jgi:hypothetical protein
LRELSSAARYAKPLVEQNSIVTGQARRLTEIKDVDADDHLDWTLDPLD